MPKQPSAEPGAILRFRDLKHRGIVTCWPTLLKWINDEKFPPGIQLGPHSRGWFESDIVTWLKSRPTAGAAKQRDHADT
jgi:predicted DNA-binding transcriptional regulator AlpA